MQLARPDGGRVALVLPQLSSAAVQGLPADRFGSGSAVNQAVRNLGATLGVAIVVALTSDLTPATALDGFHHVWWLLVASGVTVSLLSTRLVTPGFATRRPDAARSPVGAERAPAGELQPATVVGGSVAGVDSGVVSSEGVVVDGAGRRS